jgi:hypothetical protein
MTIDDELLHALLNPQKGGKVGKDALILETTRRTDFEYKLEELSDFFRDQHAVIRKEPTYICPDITIFPKSGHKIAIELENDLQWDFMASIRKIKDYKQVFETRVIIPKMYEKFAPFYQNEGFRVYLWTAIRRWKCEKCETINEKEGPFEPKCRKCKKRTRHTLVNIKDVKIEEYE